MRRSPAGAPPLGRRPCSSTSATPPGEDGEDGEDEPDRKRRELSEATPHPHTLVRWSPSLPSASGLRAGLTQASPSRGLRTAARLRSLARAALPPC